MIAIIDIDITTGQ